MATPTVIKVMLSSRCSDRFPLANAKASSLTDIRKHLKDAIEKLKPLGQTLYEVWINELQTGDGGQTAWDHCMEQARDCDIFIALFNGHAGWADDDGSVGICHAELQTAYAKAPGKVFVVNAFEAAHAEVASRDIDKRFQDYVKGLKQFEARGAVDQQGLEAAVKRTLHQATVRLVQRGVEGASIGTNHIGPPLAWSRQSYSQRAKSMQRAAMAGLQGNDKRHRPEDNTLGKVLSGKQPLLFVVSAVPDAFSVAAAREEVGQPHLRDHELKSRLGDFAGGPVHLVACHKGITEAQGRSMLGFPDAMVVSAPFGIYVADPVQGIQLALVARCRDETSTRIGVSRFLEWLAASSQTSELVRLAKKRKAVINVLADSL